MKSDTPTSMKVEVCPPKEHSEVSHFEVLVGDHSCLAKKDEGSVSSCVVEGLKPGETHVGKARACVKPSPTETACGGHVEVHTFTTPNSRFSGL